MRSILEFALFAWVGISIVAVLVQLVRIARYKRANSSGAPTSTAPAITDRPTIDLNKRLNPGTPVVSQPTGSDTADDAMASSSAPISTAPAASSAPAASPSTAQRATQAAAAASGPSTSFNTPPAFDAPQTTPAPVASTEAAATPAPAPAAEPVSTASESAKSEVAQPTETAPAEPAPTLADLLAGVRLPWNLLPTVDQSREPSNDRVVLITSEGDPADIGIDVADELERLGFTIAPRGDDTAVATRGDHALGLQIIEDPMAAEVDGTRRFPTATESSVALDIWIE